MLSNGERRLIVNVDDLRDYNREYCDLWVGSADISFVSTATEVLMFVKWPINLIYRLLKDPIQYLTAFELALTELVQSMQENRTSQKFYIGKLSPAVIETVKKSLTNVVVFRFARLVR